MVVDRYNVGRGLRDVIARASGNMRIHTITIRNHRKHIFNGMSINWTQSTPWSNYYFGPWSWCWTRIRAWAQIGLGFGLNLDLGLGKKFKVAS